MLLSRCSRAVIRAVSQSRGLIADDAVSAPSAVHTSRDITPASVVDVTFVGGRAIATSLAATRVTSGASVPVTATGVTSAAPVSATRMAAAPVTATAPMPTTAAPSTAVTATAVCATAAAVSAAAMRATSAASTPVRTAAT